MLTYDAKKSVYQMFSKHGKISQKQSSKAAN